MQRDRLRRLVGREVVGAQGLAQERQVVLPAQPLRQRVLHEVQGGVEGALDGAAQPALRQSLRERIDGHEPAGVRQLVLVRKLIVARRELQAAAIQLGVAAHGDAPAHVGPQQSHEVLLVEPADADHARRIGDPGLDDRHSARGTARVDRLQRAHDRGGHVQAQLMDRHGVAAVVVIARQVVQRIFHRPHAQPLQLLDLLRADRQHLRQRLLQAGRAGRIAPPHPRPLSRIRRQATGVRRQWRDRRC